MGAKKDINGGNRRLTPYGRWRRETGRWNLNSTQKTILIVKGMEDDNTDLVDPWDKAMPEAVQSKPLSLPLGPLGA